VLSLVAFLSLRSVLFSRLADRSSRFATIWRSDKALDILSTELRKAAKQKKIMARIRTLEALVKAVWVFEKLSNKQLDQKPADF